MYKEVTDKLKMQMVYSYGKMNCKGLNTQYGAFIFRKDSLLSCGACMPKYNLDGEDSFFGFNLNNNEFIDAESVAIAGLSKFPELINKLVMYVPIIPSSNSASKIINAGIEKVVVHEDLNKFLANNKKFNDELFKFEQQLGMLKFEHAGVKVSYVSGKLLPDDFKVKFYGRFFSP